MMRILMIQHSVWSRHYGGSRVQVELADELRRLGHHVQKYSQEDAFAGGLGRRWPRWCANLHNFAPRVGRFVRRHGARFDVIDALYGNLPFSKQDLGFTGLLVCRSVGLLDMYEQQLAPLQATRPRRAGHPVANLLRCEIERRGRPFYPASLRHADLVNVCNAEERAFVQARLRPNQHAMQLPFGLTDERRAACARVAAEAETRLAAQAVAFIGLWIERKGNREIGDIIRRILASQPRTRFKLLGVGGFHPDAIRGDLGEVPWDQITIVPSYESDALPGLLADVSAGFFPSYAEGFPFALLEKLACGIPTVAYDVPGSRETLSRIGSQWLVAPGSALSLADRVTDVLRMSAADYRTLAETCQRVAATYTWTGVAEATVLAYEGHLAAMSATTSPYEVLGE